MRLLSPSIGECVDRQTILLIKLERGQKAKIHTNQFGEECNKIQEYLEANYLALAPKTLQPTYDHLHNELKRVNETLWDLENRIRELKVRHDAKRDFDASAVVEVAFLIADYNDKRADLVKQLNALFGIHGQEKFYGA